MQIKATSTFLKQLAGLPDGVRDRVASFTFVKLPAIDSFDEVLSIKKLRGYKNCYRVRFGDYRLGIEIENGCAILRVVMHRREIYRRFP